MIGTALAMGAHLPHLVSLARLGLAPVILWLVLESRYGEAFWLLLVATVLAMHGFAVGVVWPVEVLVYATAATTVVSGTGYALTAGVRLIPTVAAP